MNPLTGVTVTVRDAGVPAATDPLVGVRVRLKSAAAGALMVMESAADVETPLSVSPLYTAVMECVPTESADVLQAAFPVPSRVPVPRVVLPSLKVTAPVGTMLPEAGLTLAVKVMLAPDVAVVADAVNVVVVAIGLTARVCALDVLEEKSLSPL